MPYEKPRWLITCKNEIWCLLIGALFIFLACSCFSFNAHDPSFFYPTKSDKVVTNWCGIVGAEVSRIFFYLFGAATYIFLVLLFVPIVMLFINMSLWQEWFRLLACGGILLSSVALFHLYDVILSHGSPGGVIGHSIVYALLMVCSRVGTKIVLWTLLAVSGIAATQLSYTQLVWWGCLGFVYTLRALVYGFTTNVRSMNALIYKGFRLLVSALVSLGLACIHMLFRPKKEKVYAHDQESVREDHGSHESQNAVKNVAKLPVKAVHWLKKSVISSKSSTILKNVSSQQSKSRAQDLNPLHFVVDKKNEVTMYDVEQEARERGRMLEEKLECFGIKGFVKDIVPGPVITMYEYQPDIDTKISRIVALEDDLALALKALSIRIVAPIPGKSVVGFEIANQSRHDVLLAHTIQGNTFKESEAHLPLILGVDSTGAPVIEDLVKSPHLLVAGATGSGKSVGLNVMLFSLLCKRSFDDLKLILIDPKRLEFTAYDDIPHLMFPIITNPRKAAPILRWVVEEMERRYDFMARAGVRNITDYHADYRDGTLKNKRNEKEGDDEEYPWLPFVVVVIDELADLMMVAGKEVEVYIARIAQMARAAGIHMIVATQRPSVDVLTGVIKVNFPSRIAFRVSSKVDSRTIVDCSGAEKLLGAGDMLYMNAASTELIRIHGSYASDEEIQKLTDHLRRQSKPDYVSIDQVIQKQQESDAGTNEEDEGLYIQVRDYIKTIDEVSISLIQRQFRIGFNRSARLIEMLEGDGLIAPAQGSKPRKVLRG